MVVLRAIDWKGNEERLAQARASAPPRRRVRRRRPAGAPPPQKFARRTKLEQHFEKERLQHGFVWHGGVRGGRYVGPIREMGLRSTDEPILRHFTSLVGRRGYLESSDEKERVYSQGSKLLGLDAQYVAGTRAFRGFFRVDLDAFFASVSHLAFELRRCGLPVMPHLVVYEVTDDGRIRNPHLYFLLPPGSAVWHAPGDSRCRRAPVDLMRAVAERIVALLEPVGADPGGLARLTHGKNPLSPLWQTSLLNPDVLPTLSQWADLLDLSAYRAPAARREAAREAGVDMRASNSIFEVLQRMAYGRLRRWAAEGDADYVCALDDRAQLGELLRLDLLDEAVRTFENGRQAAAVLKTVARYAAARWDPERMRKPRRDLGAMAGTLDGLDLTERQQAAAARTSALRVDATRDRLASAAQAVLARGETLTKAGLAREASVARTTVARHWDAVVRAAERCSVRSIDKKTLAADADQKEHGETSNQSHGESLTSCGVSTMGAETSSSCGVSSTGEEVLSIWETLYPGTEVSRAAVETSSIMDAYLAGKSLPHASGEGVHGHGKALPEAAEGSTWERLGGVEDASMGEDGRAWEASVEGEARPEPQGWIGSGVGGVDPGEVGRAASASQDCRPAHGSPSSSSDPISVVEPVHGAPGASWTGAGRGGLHRRVDAAAGPRERLAPSMSRDRTRMAVKPSGERRGSCDVAEAIRRVGYVPRSMSDLALALQEVEAREGASKPGRGW